MIGSSTFIQALVSSLTEPIDSRLTLVKKTVAAIEREQIKNTDRLSRALVKVLNSIKKDPTVTPEQLGLLAEYKARIGDFDPRLNPKSETESVEQRRKFRYDHDAEHQELLKPRAPTPQVSDGYEPDFLNAAEAIARVTNKYSESPRYSDSENQQLLQTFLGGIELNSHAANQIWQSLAREFKARGGSLKNTFTILFPPVIVAVQTALCQYVNSRTIPVPDSNALSLTDQLGFCS